MADLLDGYLRIAGEKFYAITRAGAVILEEGGTLEERLKTFKTDEILSNISKLQKQLDEVSREFSRVLDSAGGYNIQTGVYTATQNTINTLAGAGRLEDNVLYIVSNDAGLTSKVSLRVVWKTKEGQEILSRDYSGFIGTSEPVPLYNSIEYGGTRYYFYASKCPVMDRYTGKLSKQVETVPDSESVAPIWYTKNSVLEITAI